MLNVYKSLDTNTVCVCVCLSPHGVMVKAMDCRIIVSEFVLHLRYYVHFWANTLGRV